MRYCKPSLFVILHSAFIIPTMQGMHGLSYFVTIQTTVYLYPQCCTNPSYYSTEDVILHFDGDSRGSNTICITVPKRRAACTPCNDSGDRVVKEAIINNIHIQILHSILALTVNHCSLLCVYVPAVWPCKLASYHQDWDMSSTSNGFLWAQHWRTHSCWIAIRAGSSCSTEACNWSDGRSVHVAAEHTPSHLYTLHVTDVFPLRNVIVDHSWLIVVVSATFRAQRWECPSAGCSNLVKSYLQQSFYPFTWTHIAVP